MHKLYSGFLWTKLEFVVNNSNCPVITTDCDCNNYIDIFEYEST